MFRGEYSNNDTLTINHHNFIISQLNITTFYLYVLSRYINIISIFKLNLTCLTLR